MSFPKRLKLNSLQVTHYTGDGKYKKKLMKRSDDSSNSCVHHKPQPQDNVVHNIDDDVSSAGDHSHWDEIPSEHTVTQKANVEGWKSVRDLLKRSAIERAAMPCDQICVMCSECEATFRCVNCGPCAFFCYTCMKQLHEKVLIFHTPEEWKDGVFQSLKRCVTLDPHDHVCVDKKHIPLCVLDSEGTQHDVSFVCCPCEPLVVTMARAGIWPSSPTHPQIAFTFELLDWFEALLLECQVAVKDLCAALYFRCPHLHFKRRDIYGSLIDSFEEYRYMKHELRVLNCQGLDYGNICPACPKSGGKKIVSLDAIFGLPRRKKDEFVRNAPKSSKDNDEACSEFKAGTALRSLSRYHALDETAIFGAGCRHEYPVFFINLKHGERYSYAVWVIEKLIQLTPPSTEMHIIYDIACNLKRHLKNTGRKDILERISTLSVPSFHSYGHSAKCQLEFSPLRTEGIGLSDGEVLERLWSFLRRFSRMTKEMRPSHRIDVLTHALLYYCYKTSEKLFIRWKRAICVQETALQNYEELTSMKEKSICENDVLTWIKQENDTIFCSNTNNLKETLRRSVVKRAFLLQLKKKYADGQKIAKKLSSQISKETKKVIELANEIDVSGILDPSSSFWSQTLQDFPSFQIRQSIIHNYLLLQHSREEIELLKEDMLNTLTFFKEKTEKIQTCLTEAFCDLSSYGRGMYCLLYKYKVKTDMQYASAVKLFSQLIDLPTCYLSNPTIQNWEPGFDTSDISDTDESDLEVDSDGEI